VNGINEMQGFILRFLHMAITELLKVKSVYRLFLVDLSLLRFIMPQKKKTIVPDCRTGLIVATFCASLLLRDRARITHYGT